MRSCAGGAKGSGWHALRAPAEHSQAPPLLLAALQSNEVAIHLEIDLMRDEQHVLGKAERSVRVGKPINIGREMSVSRSSGRRHSGDILLLDEIPGFDIAQDKPSIGRIQLARDNHAAVRLENAHLEQI
jgi:hypothetical protein